MRQTSAAQGLHLQLEIRFYECLRDIALFRHKIPRVRWFLSSLQFRCLSPRPAYLSVTQPRESRSRGRITATQLTDPLFRLLFLQQLGCLRRARSVNLGFWTEPGSG